MLTPLFNVLGTQTILTMNKETLQKKTWKMRKKCQVMPVLFF